MREQPSLMLLGLVLLFASASAAGQQTGPGDHFRHLSWRHIGPAVFGGRISDIEVLPDNPAVIFAASATGGIFKTTNNGVTWRPVFDDAAPTLSIGDMAIAPSDPLVVWAGTGEAIGEQQPASLGNGVYRSLDGGETWKYMGLKDTRFIHRVVVHPTNPDIVFVAAPGHRWGPNAERGLYRTRDGGETWEKVLYPGENTGVVEVAMEDNGRVLYAASWQRRRNAWGNLTGGPESRIYRSIDGGSTWTELGGGLPAGNLGKTAIAIARSSPNIVYAAIGGEDGGLYRSGDRGISWRRVNDIRTSYWYGNIYVDPLDENTLWVMGTKLSVSIDGGKTFENDWTARGIHPDHHALWINPENTDHMLMGNDGGFYITYDGARNWRFLNNLPIAQYYAIGVDDRDPYHVYGGLQDNGTWGIPSRTFASVGILNEDAVKVGGGDGFVPVIDPRDFTNVYAESQFGNLKRVDLVTGESHKIRPEADEEDESYRFSWNSPVLISRHDPGIIYFGGNRLFRTADRGDTWEAISPDLTKNEDTADWTIMGLSPALRSYNTLTAIDESALRQGLIYTGADDGSVYRTADGGGTWTSLSSRFDLDAPGRFVTDIHASVSDPAVAYVAFTGHFEDDFRPQLFKTGDAGDSWVRITGDMPDEAVVLTIQEHPDDPDLLFAGVHNGLMVSLDGGKHWRRAGGNLPPVSVNDLRLKDGDLVLGTYGRGIVILDDVSFLAQATDRILEDEAFLFPVRAAELFYPGKRDYANKAARFSGPNPDYGALITYYLREVPADAATQAGEAGTSIRILDADGTVVRELTAPARRGFSRIAWDLQTPVATPDTPDETADDDAPAMVDVEPGVYTVTLSVGEREWTQTLEVIPDRRRSEP